eukprot:CAMPEP_0194062676 /NCGR_PEP_ID=MMETSP0009_2-20130614/78181_1 /TAXON_ID=210454 /ORGANISM="Grammatophora oceanica, Strain CCMP 410" /LENGTH=66 /DNA_ID=CAMNT_0038714495 /DNA_START=193 /DNA_END=393 /DNA_ORIENTATION=+
MNPRTDARLKHLPETIQSRFTEKQHVDELISDPIELRSVAARCLNGVVVSSSSKPLEQSETVVSSV